MILRRVLSLLAFRQHTAAAFWYALLLWDFTAINWTAVNSELQNSGNCLNPHTCQHCLLHSLVPCAGFISFPSIASFEIALNVGMHMRCCSESALAPPLFCLELVFHEHLLFFSTSQI
jgi:hypothetical protein